MNWFSPLLPARTDIAHYTARVIPALSEVLDVTIWTDQEKWDRNIEQYCKVRWYDKEHVSWLELYQGGLTFYNIGNNADFHLGIWHVCRKHRGIMVLHDIALQEFFAYCYRWVWGDKEGYLAKMAHYYGEDARRDGDLFWQDRLKIDCLVERYPFTQVALEQGLAAIVHNDQAIPADMSDTCGIVPLPLPYVAHQWPGASDRWTRSDPLRLVIFGYISRNRRMEAVLEALGRYPHPFQLDMYGQYWDPEYIRGLIRSLRLEDRVRLRGFVPEAELDAALEQAHLAFNLRFPTMGESSGSQLRIWDHSLASLVTPVGWYARLPKDSVGFARVDHEIEDIHAHLDRLRADPAAYREMGRCGRKILESVHSPHAYARRIRDLVARAGDLYRRAAAFQTADQVVDVMGRWITRSAAETLVGDSAEQILRLTGDGGVR